jgi:3-oxoacyl-[acyl-carrier-protein] synthase-3
MNGQFVLNAVVRFSEVINEALEANNLSVSNRHVNTIKQILEFPNLYKFGLTDDL